MPTAYKNGVPYEEVPRHDEPVVGVAEPAQAEAGGERRQNGTLAQGASTIPTLGGKAHKGRTSLSHRLEAPTLSALYAARARTLRNALTRETARDFGGGVCGVAASLFLKFASQKTAAAEEAFTKGDFETHRKLSESARMDILYAREHATKQAQSAPRAETSFVATVHAALAGKKGGTDAG